MLFNVQDRSNTKLVTAAVIAERVLKDPDFLELVRKETHYSYTNDVPRKVANQILLGTVSNEIAILTYRTWNPWSPTIGYSDGSDIYVNTRKMSVFTVSDYVGNFIHEFLHHIGYGHGDNSPIGKEQSVPYRVGNMAVNYAEKLSKA